MTISQKIFEILDSKGITQKIFLLPQESRRAPLVIGVGLKSPPASA